jgi:hypothetical protein
MVRGWGTTPRIESFSHKCNRLLDPFAPSLACEMHVCLSLQCDFVFHAAPLHASPSPPPRVPPPKMHIRTDPDRICLTETWPGQFVKTLSL